MRFICIPIFAMIVASCQAQPSQSTIKYSPKPSNKKLIAEDKIMNFIIEDVKKKYSHLQVKEVNDEGWHELTFTENLDDDSEAGIRLSTVRIPNYTLVDEVENNPIKGDLNQDKVKDYLVKVVDEGGGGGGNMALISYYLFASQNGKYVCSSIRSAEELCGCQDNYGYFIAERIHNHVVKGISHCYAENDGRCCPSLKYESVASFQDGGLHLISRKEIDITK